MAGGFASSCSALCGSCARRIPLHSHVLEHDMKKGTQLPSLPTAVVLKENEEVVDSGYKKWAQSSAKIKTKPLGFAAAAW